MKSAFCLLMSLYVLLLSVLPCTDGSLPVLTNGQPTQLAADRHTHDSDRPTDDHCSPLCSCACCGTVLGQPSVFAFTFAPPHAGPQPVPTLVPPCLPTVVLPTWQPPQLA